MTSPSITKIDVSLAARQYVAKGWALVPIERGTKGPNSRGWNLITNCITQPDQCSRIRDNVGLALAYSRLCTLDVDNLDKATAWLSGHGIALASLLAAEDAVRICSGRPGRAKLLYRLPDGVAPLASKEITYLSDEIDERTGKPKKRAVLELRCATADGLTVQDVLPPSIHPDTGEAYTWEYGDDLIGHWSSPPDLPPELLALWQSLLKPRENLEVSDKAPLGLGKRELRELLTHYDCNAGYHEWIEIGFALHHETRGGELGFDLWDEWSATGTTYQGREDLLQHWDSFGKRSTGPIKTVRSLLNAAGVSADEFEDLTLVPANGEAPVKLPKFHVQGAASFSSGPPLKWLVKNVLPKAQLAVIYGESGAGKTFAVTDLILAIVRGTEWRGHRVNKGRAVYVCGEGLAGFRSRLQAFAQHHDADLAEIDQAFGVVADVPNFLAHDDKALAQQVIAWGGADVIVIDTLAQVTPGGNENSGEDMGKALAHCRRLHQATGALVVLIHHSGKDPGKGARGWSGLKGATDVELEVLRDGEQRAIRVSKMKDGQGEGQEMAFSLLPVTLGLDEDGDEITSCVVEASESTPRHQRKVEPKGNVQRNVMRVLHDLMGLDMGAVLTTDLIESAVNQMVAPDPGKRDQRRAHVLRALEALTAGNQITINGQEVTAC